MNYSRAFKLLIFGCCSTLVKSWDYNDFAQWCEVENELCCTNRPEGRQSPIDIITSSVVVNTSLNAFPLSYGSGYFEIQAGNYTNNGKTAQWDISPAATNPPTLLGGPLGTDVYELAQFHFHWGSSNDRGSEHFVDGFQYCAEIHLVHFNRKYGSLGGAVSQSDGLAVLGIFFDCSAGTQSPPMARLSNKARSLRFKDSKITLNMLLNDILVEPSLLGQYWTYPGSLTTPGCAESVTWLVVKNPIPCKATSDLVFFRQMRTTAKGVTPWTKQNNNYRLTPEGTLMPINNRIVQTPS